jgi:subtilase family serine protease
MRPKTLFAIQCIALLTLVSIPALQVFAQSNDVQPRITQAVNETKLTLLKGNTFPLARREFDQGAAPPSQAMETMMLGLKRSPAQEAALEKLMAEQLDRSSPNFHKWLAPVEFGKQFGPADQDIKVVTSWLESHGFQSVEVSNGRTVIEFDGNVGQVQAAFHTVIHNYFVNGKEHYANASDPSIPTALTPVVTGVASLHNFHKKPMYVPAHLRNAGSASPLYTFAGGCDEDNNCYGLGPTDFAIIYDVTPLWNAGIDGTGQNIAVIGQSDVNMQDITTFRSVFGLPANAPVKVLAGTDPGIVEGDETESDLDLEWAGAVAKGATLQFVVSESVDTSAQYAVDHTPLVATVLSESYGLCELQIGTTENGIINSRWQQAAGEGITAVIATGDAGSAACDITPGNATPPSPPVPAQNGLQVSGLASTPYNVAVGGTDFDDANNPLTYWNPTNTSGTLASAKSYIPEITWNSTCSSTQLLQGDATEESDCNDATDFGTIQWTVAGSGGMSNCTTSDGETPASCSGGYAKPSWQVATGVPNDGKRDIPDVSLFAGNGFNGNFYLICAADQTGGQFCNASNFNDFYPIGGTSGSTPTFAAIIALVNQKTASTTGLGNANAVLYPMASSQPAAFHDITTGTIAVLCTGGSPNCNKTVSSDTYGILTGYNAGPGYDLATGLGSVDAANLVNNWGADSTSPNFNLAFSASSITIASPGGMGTTSLSVNATNGFSGTVTFSCSSLPTESSCSFTPPSVTGSGSTTVTITTTKASVMTPLHRPTGLNAGPKAFELCLVSIGLLWMATQVKRRRWSSVATTLAVFCLLGAAACGGGGSGGSGGTTPVQNQPVVITATAGTTTHTATLSVTVN